MGISVKQEWIDPKKGADELADICTSWLAELRELVGAMECGRFRTEKIEHSSGEAVDVTSVFLADSRRKIRSLEDVLSQIGKDGTGLTA